MLSCFFKIGFKKFRLLFFNILDFLRKSQIVGFNLISSVFKCSFVKILKINFVSFYFVFIIFTADFLSVAMRIGPSIAWISDTKMLLFFQPKMVGPMSFLAYFTFKKVCFCHYF